MLEAFACALCLFSGGGGGASARGMMYIDASLGSLYNHVLILIIETKKTTRRLAGALESHIFPFNDTDTEFIMSAGLS